MTRARRGAGVLTALLVTALAVVAPATLPRARAAGALDVVTVLDQGDGARAVVAEVSPAPAAPLPADAASVAVDGAAVPATVTPLLAQDAPLALVIDATTSGAAALPQRLSAAAGLLLQLPPSTPVSVVLDRSPPQILAERTTPAAAIHALATVTAAGGGSTAQAVAQATASMATSTAPAASAVVLLGTEQPAPSGNAGADLANRLRQGHVVLALVTDPGGVGGGWSTLVRATGGAEAGAPPDGTPDAVDDVAARLRARYVVRFTPPAGASSARVTLTAGGEQSAADVPLAARAADGSATPPATAPAQAAPPPQAASGGTSGAGHLAPLVLLGLAALAVLVALGAAAVAVRRRGARAPAPEGPVPSPDDAVAPDAGLPEGPDSGAGSAASEAATLEPVPLPGGGVRYFDISDPNAPREITAPPPRGDYVGKHRQAGITEAEVTFGDDPDDLEDDADAEDRAEDHAEDRAEGHAAVHADEEAFAQPVTEREPDAGDRASRTL